MLANAREKLLRKGLDLIVANRVPASFGAGEQAVTLVSAGGEESLAAMPKARVAEEILDRIGLLLDARAADAAAPANRD